MKINKQLLPRSVEHEIVDFFQWIMPPFLTKHKESASAVCSRLIKAIEDSTIEYQLNIELLIKTLLATKEWNGEDYEPK